jgi:uncharacterized YigZ family protein
MRELTLIDSYQTIEKPTEGIFKDRGSKFLAFAYPVFSEDEVKEIQKKLRKKYYDAVHHCFAFRLGADKKIFRMSDDGEPANSSAPPIYNQIRSKDLTNILVVVVRYFGGTKLGIPGLINAYKTATEEALNKASIITRTINEVLEIQFEYQSINEVKKIIKEENLEEISQKFELVCSITIGVRQSICQSIIQRLNKISTVRITQKGIR